MKPYGQIDMTDTNEFRLLVMSDLHYGSRGDPAHPRRNDPLSAELALRAIADARRRGGFDALAIAGDLTGEHRAPDAADVLADLAGQVRHALGETPLLVVPGNHDGDPARIASLFGQTFGERDLGGYRFVTFADPYTQDEHCTRRDEDRALLARAARDGKPLVVLQHNPMNPVIEDAYPYMLTNRQAVMDDYRRCGVVLSISGHYHPGQDVSEEGGVRYVTAPALYEAPFGYLLVTLRGRQIRVERRQLAIPPDWPALWDCHVHTPFAYCGSGLRAADTIDRARLFGLAGLCFTEHAPQLYCNDGDFFAGQYIANPALWREGKHARMPEFRRQFLPLRSAFVKVGLEVELDGEGRLTLADEDRHWPDLLVGAVHFLRGLDQDPQGHPELNRDFMAVCEGLLAGGVDILAHPWRFFSWFKHRVPVELYDDLARMLAAHGTAAEINFHSNTTDPAFLEACLKRGVKIAFGSDTHRLHQVGNLSGHLALLQQVAGVRDPRDVADLLFVPGQSKTGGRSVRC